MNNNNKFTWDFWYIYDPSKQTYHVYMLSADAQYKVAETHHIHSQITYATTQDFHNFNYQSDNLIPLNSDKSIWTGCTIKVDKNRYYLFYTERQTVGNYLAGQTIKAAYSKDLVNWRIDENFHISPEIIDRENKYFVRQQNLGDRTAHAWRDPYIFQYKNTYYMLLAAKHIIDTKHLQNKNACIALLKSDDRELTNWQLVQPSLITGYEELEVPQIYLDSRNGSVVLLVSTWDEVDYQISFERKQTYRKNGKLLAFSAENIEAALRGEFCEAPQIVIGKDGEIQADLYACLWLSEIKSIVGFNLRNGGYKVIRSGIPDHIFNLEYLNLETQNLFYV